MSEFEHGTSVDDLCADNDRLIGEIFARDREIRALLKKVERIVAARKAEAVDRERAAWATKIEPLIARYDNRDIWGGVADRLRALLAADDTQATTPGRKHWISDREYVIEPADDTEATP